MAAERTDSAHGRYGPGWWLAAFGLWTLLAVLSITQSALYLAYHGQTIQWFPMVQARLVDWYTCALFVPALVWLSRRFPLGRGRFLKHGSILLAATSVFVIAKYALLFYIAQRVSASAGRTLTGLLAANAITELMIFWAVIGILHAVEFYHRMQDRERTALLLEAELSQARLSTLAAQLRPHFLFNTLNGITTLMRRDVDAADRVLTKLADLLSATLRQDDKQEIPLREEMQLLDRYIDIMQVRFGDRLTVEKRISAALGDALVPPFLLQPLVENALEHGIGRRPGAGVLTISADAVGDVLRLIVTDDGPGPAAAPAHGTGDGIGLANIRARVAHLYGSAHSVALEPAPGNGTRAVVEIPLRTQPS